VTGFWYFLQIPSVTMTDSDPGEEGSAEESCAEQQNSEGDDDVQEVEAPASRASDKPILRLPERNDEDTDWTRTDGTKPASVKNKMPVEDMAIVRQRKELMRAAVAKNQVVDRWLRDQIKSERWERIATPFPHGNKHLPKQQCVLMTEDTKTPSPYSTSLVSLLLPFLVSPSSSFVAGHVHGQHRLTHCKGGRRDGLECGGNVCPVAQRTVHHLQDVVCVLAVLRKPKIEKFKSLYTPKNLFVEKLRRALYSYCPVVNRFVDPW
jgi:hypothetical protein